MSLGTNTSRLITAHGQLFQVRIQRAVATPPSSSLSSPPVDVESDAAAEPAEQDDLLDRGAAAERSDWL